MTYDVTYYQINILIQKAYSDKAMVQTQNEDNTHTSVMHKQ
jgi:hypothetical protein